jgi:hypothetical protein
MHNGCRRLREPTWALPSLVGWGVTIVAGAGTTVGRPARLTGLITALPGSPANLSDDLRTDHPVRVGPCSPTRHTSPRGV